MHVSDWHIHVGASFWVQECGSTHIYWALLVYVLSNGYQFISQQFVSSCFLTSLPQFDTVNIFSFCQP